MKSQALRGEDHGPGSLGSLSLRATLGRAGPLTPIHAGGEAPAGARIPGEQGRKQKALELMPSPEGEQMGEGWDPLGTVTPNSYLPPGPIPLSLLGPRPFLLVL